MFSTPTPFEEAFPTIDEIDVKIEETGYMVTNKSSYSMTKENLRPDFPCHNKSCKKNSGINIQSLISKMVREKTKEYDDGLLCRGQESRRKCMNSYDVK